MAAFSWGNLTIFKPYPAFFLPQPFRPSLSRKATKRLGWGRRRGYCYYLVFSVENIFNIETGHWICSISKGKRYSCKSTAKFVVPPVVAICDLAIFKTISSGGSSALPPKKPVA